MNKKSKLLIVFILLLISTLAYAVFAFNSIMNKNEYIAEGYNNKNYNQVMENIIIISPEISSIIPIGSESAPLTFAIVIDFNSEESKKFYDSKMFDLYNKYIPNSQARIYYKYLISKEELDNKDGRYGKIQASKCALEILIDNTNAEKQIKILEFQKYLLNNKKEDIDTYKNLNDESYYSSIATRFDIDNDNFRNCFNENNIKSNNYKSMHTDMIETEQFAIYESIYVGINGKDNAVTYMGNSLDQIYKTIRLKEIRVGLN